jgi:hypothetical protein
MSFNPTYRLQNLTVTGLTTLNNLIVNGTTNLGTGTVVVSGGVFNSITATGATINTLNLTGNMSGANAYLQNLAVNNGLAVGGTATFGYNGVQIIGSSGQKSLNILSGDVIVGSNAASNLAVSGNVSTTGSVSVGSNLTVAGTTTLGTLALTNVTVTNATATNATITNLTATNETVASLTGTVANIATLNATTENVATINVTSSASGANAYWQNESINGGLAVGGLLTVGYNGMQVIGLNGTTSLNVLSGDIIFGSDLASNVRISGNLQVTGTSTLPTVSSTTVNATTVNATNATVTNATATNATITNATITNATATNATVSSLTGTTAAITTLRATTATAATLNVTSSASGANSYWDNQAINAGLAVGGKLTVGYSGMQVVGANGTTSVQVNAGNVLIGSSLPSNVSVSGNVQATGSATIGGALNVTGLSTVSSVNASGSVLAGLVGATTGTFTQLNCSGLFSMATGSNARIGSVSLASGLATVANTTVNSTDVILLTRQTLASTPANTGFLSYTITDNTQFDITSSNLSDDGLINYLIVRRQ